MNFVRRAAIATTLLGATALGGAVGATMLTAPAYFKLEDAGFKTLANLAEHDDIFASTGYLMKNWLAGKDASCSSPAYVRDNIHASLLAKAYAEFAGRLPASPGFSRLNPIGYAESQGAFTLRMAQEMRPRLNLPCVVSLLKQTDFPEPRVRVNTDILDVEALGWDEARAWDELADYHLKAHAGATAR